MHNSGTRSGHSATVRGKTHVHRACKGVHRKDGCQLFLAIETLRSRRFDSHAFYHGGRADPGPSPRRRGILEGNIARSATGTRVRASVFPLRRRAFPADKNEESGIPHTVGTVPPSILYSVPVIKAARGE